MDIEPEMWPFTSGVGLTDRALRTPLLVRSGFELQCRGDRVFRADTVIGPVIVSYHRPYPEIIFESLKCSPQSALVFLQQAVAYLQVEQRANVSIPSECSTPQIRPSLFEHGADDCWPGEPNVGILDHSQACIADAGEKIVIIRSTATVGGFSNDFSHLGEILASSLGRLPIPETNNKKMAIACQLFASASTATNLPSRFIQLVTILEILADEVKLAYGAQTWLKSITSELPSGVDEDDWSHIRNTLKHLSGKSITKSIITLVIDHYFGSQDLETEAVFTNVEELEKKVKKIYGLRSQLMHRGDADCSVNSFRELLGLTDKIVFDLLVARLRQSAKS